jgi:hypothetical protein
MDRPGVRPPHRCSPRRRARAGPSATRRRSRRQAAAAEDARLLAEAAIASRGPAVTRLDQELAELHRTAEELARHGALEADWRTATRTASAAAAAVALAKQERDQLGNRARRRRARTDRADAGGISRAACRADSHQPVTVSTVGSAEPLTREPSGGANTPGWPSNCRRVRNHCINQARNHDLSNRLRPPKPRDPCRSPRTGRPRGRGEGRRRRPRPSGQ